MKVLITSIALIALVTGCKGGQAPAQQEEKPVAAAPTESKAKAAEQKLISPISPSWLPRNPRPSWETSLLPKISRKKLTRSSPPRISRQRTKEDT